MPRHQRGVLFNLSKDLARQLQRAQGRAAVHERRGARLQTIEKMIELALERDAARKATRFTR